MLSLDVLTAARDVLCLGKEMLDLEAEMGNWFQWLVVEPRWSRGSLAMWPSFPVVQATSTASTEYAVSKPFSGSPGVKCTVRLRARLNVDEAISAGGAEHSASTSGRITRGPGWLTRAALLPALMMQWTTGKVEGS
ncbi:hypothetical protein AOLI_G00311140 [Acnodon oligacanthus]